MLAEAKGQLNELGSDFDATIGAFVTVAREHTEIITDRALVSQTWDVYLGGFPCGTAIELPLGKLQTVDEFVIRYADGSEVEWTVNEDGDLEDSAGVVAHVDNISHYGGKIRLAHGRSWPVGTLRTSNPIRIRITAGWTNAAAVPSPIRQYILLVLSDLFENREKTVVGTAQTVVELPIAETLLANWRLR